MEDHNILVHNLQTLLAPNVTTVIAQVQMQDSPSSPLYLALQRQRREQYDCIPTGAATDAKSSKNDISDCLPSNIHPKYGGFRKRFADFYDSIDTTLIEPVLSEQDRLFGVNMYTSLRPGDEIVVDSYVLRGLTLEMALRRLFSKRYEGYLPQNPPSQQAKDVRLFFVVSRNYHCLTS
jgi:hypothetical protein